MNSIKQIALALVALMAMNGCTTINIIFGGSDSSRAELDSGARPMLMGDAGIPMGDAGMYVASDAAPLPTPDAGSDSAVIVEADAAIGPAIIIEPHTMRQSTILVAGPDVWQNVASYRFRASDGSIASLEGVNVMLDGDYGDLTQVSIASEGVIRGSGTFPSGAGSSYTRIDITGSPISVGTDGYGYFQIWVRVANVQSSASVSGATVGVCNSGDRFRLGAYGIEYRIGSTVESTHFDPMYGNEFVVRRTKPTVTRQSLSTTTLADGSSQDLYRFQVSADSAGSVSFHSIAFTAISSGDLTFSGFGLRRGSTLMNTADYDIVDEYANNLEAGAISFSSGVSHRLIIVFHDDGETVTGSGSSYTLQAVPSDVHAGDTISLTFHRTLNGSTGYLLDDPIHSALDVSPWGSAGTVPPIAAGFIWSDLSEVPHSDFYGCCGGSRDWTDGLYIEDLTQTQTLSR
ncbi:hypothetical protein IPH19_02985 [Candidatus Uhrbacteria bacterium]|nr:MAG: hypothetical protein IPH19_02985 [Candidatus Uhrbacteria bacterium]